jgi:hypothetical protein
VAVTSNIGFADTKSIALKIAEVFAEQARRSVDKSTAAGTRNNPHNQIDLI